MTKKITKLFNKNFFLFWQGQTVSRIGSQIYFMAMMLWVKEATDSATLMGLLGMVAGIPSILLAPIGGTFADKYSRKKIIVGSDIINGIVILTLAFIFFYTDSDKNIIVPTLFVVAITSGLVSSFFTPAVAACIPDLVPNDKLTTANSFTQLAAPISTIFGWILSGILYQKIGMSMLILINGSTFIFGAISKSIIEIPQKKLVKRTGGKPFGNFIKDLKVGLKFVLNTKGLRRLVFVSLFIGFFSTPINLLLIFYVSDVLFLKEIWFSYLLSSTLVGGIVGSVIAGITKINSKKRSNIIVIMMLLNSVSTLLLAFNSSKFGAIAILFISGLSTGFVTVFMTTIMQISTSQEIRGRVFGFIGTITGALIPLGMGLTGVLTDLAGKNIPLIYSISGIVLIIISLYVFFSKEIRKFLALKISNEQNSFIKSGLEEEIILSAEDIDLIIKNKNK